MKKVFVIVIVLVASGLALPVINAMRGQPRGTALTTRSYADPRVRHLAERLEGPCADCHLEGLAAPFYATWPIASTLVERDKREGLRWFDMAEALHGPDGDPSEAGLAMIEHVLQTGQMPPLAYLALHWRAATGSREREAVLGAIREIRVARFAPAGLPERVAARVVHPLPSSVPVDPAKVALGEKLYHDKRLSGDDTVACASCHDLARGGTDQARVSTGIRGQQGPINAPTTFNALFHVAQFWDGRARDLQEQAAGPPENPIEMGTTFAAIVGKLEADEALRGEFVAAYPQGISKETITHAIAEFEKTLITPDSPFDRFLMGDEDAVDAQQKRGWEVFQREGCATCHVGRLLGGRSFERMGRARDYFQARGGSVTEADLGRYNVTKQERDRHRFKVPSLRNVALTYPYFHDGTVPTLEEAVQKMAEFQVGRRLSDEDVASVVAFLKGLTGTWRGRPL